MKKILLFILFFINISYFCFAQQDERVRKAEAIQIAYLTKELGLTPEEAQKFWPVFNNYRDEIKRAKTQNNTGVVELEEQIVNIRKKYKAEFKKVLPDDKRVNKVFKAERDLVTMFQKELENRKSNDVPKQKGNKKF
jgi:tRNA U34 5-carboxymethylaminomethyl modifying GTPase MnmE/TrmE